MFRLSFQAQLILIFILFLIFLFVIYLLIKKKLNIEYSLIWIFLILIATLFISSNEVILFITKLIGAKQPASTLSFLSISFIFIVLIYFSMKISVISIRLKDLIQYVALFEKRLKEIEKDNDYPESK